MEWLAVAGVVIYVWGSEYRLFRVKERLAVLEKAGGISTPVDHDD